MWLRSRIYIVLPCLFLIYMFVSLFNTEPPNATARRINRAVQLLELTKERNEELRAMVLNFSRDPMDNPSTQQVIKNAINSDGSQPLEPNLEYELLRRRIRKNIAEIWNYFNYEMGKIREKLALVQPSMDQEIDQVLELGAEHTRSLLSDLERLRQVDGFDTWREQEARHLSDLVQRRLHYLQNPKDCKSAGKLVCELDKDCDFGCQLHFVVYCFIAAYAMERTMILKSVGWRYDPSGWDQVFLPVSETCNETRNVDIWPDTKDGRPLNLAKGFQNEATYLPPAIPEDLAPRLQRLHGDPSVWWEGQFLKYLLRPQKGTADFLEASKATVNWRKPIVGMLVRRKDELYTSSSIDEYMLHVEDYFLTLDINSTMPVRRRIFLTTDDENVFAETRKKYPQYEVIGGDQMAEMATDSWSYSRTILNDIIRDIHFLSHCDYLVCTFSSHVCRVAYEMMQTLHPDAAHRFKSLDDIPYAEGQNTHQWQAVVGHEARTPEEIDMRPGDLVGVAGNNWNGFSSGENLRTHQRGLLPSFKVVDKIKTAKMPLYEQASMQV